MLDTIHLPFIFQKFIFWSFYAQDKSLGDTLILRYVIMLYTRLRYQENPVNAENFWIEALDVDVDDIDWASVHDDNFNSTIETQIKAFYFKIFHRAICTNTHFFIKFVELILLCVIFVKNQLNPTFICFVSATKSVPYGIIWALLLIRNVVIIWICLTFRKCLAWIYWALSIVGVLIFWFFIWNFIFIDVDSSNVTPISKPFWNSCKLS